MKTLSLAFSAFLLSTTMALAAGSSGTTAGSAPVAAKAPAPMTAPKNSPLAMHCKAGEVVKTMKVKGKSKKMCAKVTGSLVPDDDLYHQGYVLAKAGEYDWAIQVLSSVTDQNNPDVLNMLGYSNRKAGRVELGISYYAKALELKPDFVLAREYLGEGYVAAGKIDLAKTQLDEIQKICGTTCKEYKDLSAVINNSAI